MLGGGLAVVLLGGLIAVIVSIGTVAMAVYSLVTSNAVRGYRLGITAIVGALFSMLLSLPFWVIALRGTDSYGQRVDYTQSWPIAALVLFETLVFIVAVSGTIRQRRRRAAIARASAGVPWRG